MTTTFQTALQSGDYTKLRGAGTQGTTQTQPGDHGKPAAPTPAEIGPQPGAVNRDPGHSAAPGR